MRRALPALTAATALLAACESDPVRPSSADRRLSPGAPSYAGTVDQRADLIVSNIRTMHMPAPLRIIVDPRFYSGVPGDPGFNELEYFMHTGDAAIWTGHYLAAEAFR